MKTVRLTEVLEYYDGVQVFAAQDTEGTRYVGVMVDSTDEADSYLVVAADPGPLRWFYAGELDLKPSCWSLPGRTGIPRWYRTTSRSPYSWNRSRYRYRRQTTSLTPAYACTGRRWKN